MPDTLARICAEKRDHIAACRARISLAELEERLHAVSPPRGFLRALARHVEQGKTALITEIKRASPSGGLIRPDFDPAALARAYESAGAACLSVLTDMPYFQGADAHLTAARNACSLPVLRKDFMLDPYQVTEARVLGADCILLILAALSDAQAAELESAALALGMDVLLEVHDEAELERALKLTGRLIGINNRNLKTLTIDLATTERLAPLAPNGYTLVSESGIRDHADITRLREIGVSCFLVGESLLRQPDIAAATRALRSGSSES